MPEPSKAFKGKVRDSIIEGDLNPRMGTGAIKEGASLFIFRTFEECKGDIENTAVRIAPYFKEDKEKILKLLRSFLTRKDPGIAPERVFAHLIAGWSIPEIREKFGKSDGMIRKHALLLLGQLANITDERKKLESVSDMHRYARSKGDIVKKAVEAGVNEHTLNEVAENIMEFFGNQPEKLEEIGIREITREGVKDLLREYFEGYEKPSWQKMTLFAHMVAGITREEGERSFLDIKRRIKELESDCTSNVNDNHCTLLLARLANLTDSSDERINKLSQVGDENRIALRIGIYNEGKPIIDKVSMDEMARDLTSLPIKQLRKIFEKGSDLKEVYTKKFMWHKLLQFFIRETKLPDTGKMRYSLPDFVLERLEEDSKHSDPLIRDNAERTLQMLGRKKE